jgi:hypothetical protein
MSNDFALSAIGYLQVHGARARYRIEDDINRASGTNNWDEAHRLQRTQLRISRLQFCEQMSLRLTAERQNSYC